MTLHTYDVEQRSEEWHALRRGIVTASNVGQLLTAKTLRVADNPESRGLTAQLVAERITGVTEDTYTSADMWRGIECEPIARDKYAEVNGVEVAEMGFMIRDELGWRLGCSPDGLVGDDGLIEIKCPRAKGHLNTIADDEVPRQYMAQCQAALFVSGRQWLDYVSFHGGMPLYTKRVLPDPRWHDAIAAACRAFEKAADELTDTYLTKAAHLPKTERVLEEIF